MARSPVSVVIPTYNRAALVARALDSVLQQTRPPAEVIVVDDGSGDATASVVGRFPGVTLIRQANYGVSVARNRGVALARQPWLAFLDADDQWLPEKLEKQLAASVERPEIHIWHCDEAWIRNGRRVNPGRRHAKSGGDLFGDSLALCLISPSAVLLRRELFLVTGGFDERLPACEDYDLWLRITCRHPVGYVNEPLVRKYGGHADQLSRRYPAMDRFRIASLLNLLDSGCLDPGQHRQAAAMLAKKLDIYGNGAKKRGRDAELRALWQRFDSLAVAG